MGRRKRLDLGSIDDATARRLFERYLRIAKSLAPLYPGVEREELLSAARIAILEAHLSFREGAGCNQDTWTRRHIYWRLSEAAKELRAVGSASLGTDPQVLNGASPEQQFWQTTALRAVGRLSPRRQVLISAWIQGETYAEAGATIGVSGPLAHRETHAALEELREILENSDLW